MTDEHEPYEVRATPDWPPIAIPGRPGWWRHCGPNGEQIDAPTKDHEAALRAASTKEP